MNEEELKAYESVKSMFEGITIKNVTTESKMTLYPMGIMDVLRIIPVIERQEKLINMLFKDIYESIQNDDNATILSIKEYCDSTDFEEIKRKYYEELKKND